MEKQILIVVDSAFKNIMHIVVSLQTPGNAYPTLMMLILRIITYVLGYIIRIEPLNYGYYGY